MSYSPQAPNCYDVIAKLAKQYPQEFADCHRPERGERAWAFVRLAAWVLHSKVDRRFGLNGKRGNVGDLSMDAVSFVNPASPAGGVEVYDIVKSAGETDPRKPQPAAAWIDQTIPTVNAGTIGSFVQPQPVSESNVPPPPPPPDPEPEPDEPFQCETCEVVKAQLAALHEQHALIIQHQAGLATKQDVETLYRLIADHVIAEHLDDVKKRVDRNHAAIAAKDGGCRFPRLR